MKKTGFVLLALLLAGCSSIDKRLKLADDVAASAGMQKQEIPTSTFLLTSYYKITDKNKPVTIYIEGDGFARVTIRQTSLNPTPLDAFTLRLAAEDPSPNVIYIARPCQYTPLEKDGHCENKYWSLCRFSKEVVDSVNDAVSYYAKSFANPQINLVGYSGGAAVATLIAAEREDVSSLRTVAGNLDHVAVNKFHNVTNLDDSLNPIDVAGKLANLPQYHFAGEKDEIVPLSVTQEFAAKSDNGNGCVKIHTVSGATHRTGWKENWPQLLALPVSCNVKKSPELTNIRK